ncbi:PREDICTED: E3 ubiquitin-protein ligase UHRF1-like [Priapulus caudatus]|uniref:RING-type E3 ubiquitin transferase n=1 Tax=Priapulus caudatus TaxID=37621 RepID=A0ABM1EMB0_PRICU|nr:PREDICTED: E3 ubiquitin-protein ligase UHRF1-like [Priapulus caudatus]
MWIQVRTFDGKQSMRVDGLSKLTKIEDLRGKLANIFNAEPERQRLFYRGKQMVNGHTLFDYSVGLNEIVQIMIRPPDAVTNISVTDKSECDADNCSSGDESVNSNKENEPQNKTKEVIPTEESEPMHCDLVGLYEVEDLVDARDNDMNAWFEATIVRISAKYEGDCANKNQKASQSTTTSQISGNGCSQSSLTAPRQLMEATDTPTPTPCNTDTPAPTPGDTDTATATPSEKGTPTPTPGDADAPTPTPCDTDTRNPATNGDCPEQNNNLQKDGQSEEHPRKQGENDVEGAEGQAIDAMNSEVADVDNVEVPSQPTDSLIYHIRYTGYEEDGVSQLRCSDVRPRARKLLKLDEIKPGMTVMANFNYDERDERGYWYDVRVTGVRNTRTIKQLFGTVHIGLEKTPLTDCKIIFVNEIFKVERPGFVTPNCSPLKRLSKPECSHCNDNPRRKCKECACGICGGKSDPNKQILCDECDAAYHIFCLDPPLEAIPDVDEWYCPLCKNDASEVVKAGEKLKHSKKKMSMPSAKSTCKRDWGKGMACVGRTKECRIVPPNHWGPVPGVEVGMMWKFRVQASEVGVHRPHVAGIHGRETEGAYSIVLSGGYEDDVDRGDEFTYTGSGGRDLSGNKRTAEQSSDQMLTRMNMALAKNCNAKVDAKNGAKATNWQAGKPVRVVRNCKGRKHSKYAPTEGNRYDGIYKIVEYWQEKGQSGFKVWRYLLRRDDLTPAPWSKAGQKRVKELGLEMQYPEGYLEAQESSRLEKEEQEAKAEAMDAEEAEGAEDGSAKKGRKSRKSSSKTPGKGKRKREESPDKSPKKAKVPAYKMESALRKLIAEDELNKKLWDECLVMTKQGSQKFLAVVEEHVCCICCQNIAVKPITTKCAHNICQACLQRSFKAEVYSCPACRTDLGKDYSMSTNKTLTQILRTMFPGYENGR